MTNDPLAHSAITYMGAALILIVTALFILYLLVRSRERRQPESETPKKLSREALFAIAVGIATPIGVFVYALNFSPFATMTPRQMHQREAPKGEERLLAMGKSLFGVHCAVCHGSDGNAPDGKGANLTHRISFESALLNIQRGANNFKRTFPGGMPPMIADTDRAAQVAHYVSSGFSENEQGQMLYEKLNCARCHGDDGRGRQYLGPNIRAFDLPTVALVLKNGKNGVIGKMPKFDRFDDEQVEALGRYVLSLSESKE